MMFRDREAAGRILAERLVRYAGRRDVLVLALPRGGVEVARPVADRLGAPMDLFLVRKIGLPGAEELAIGAVATGDVRYVDTGLVERLALSENEVDAAAERASRELERRRGAFFGDRPDPVLRGRVCIFVDDGMATGSTMRAALTAAKLHEPTRLVAAVPVGAADTCRSVQDFADEVVCVSTPAPFFAVGEWYEDFRQLTDEDVRALLNRPTPEKGAAA